MKRSIIKWSPAVLMMAAFSFIGSSCQKSFKPTSYAPPQTFNGYASSDEVGASSRIAYWAFDGSLIDSISNTSGVNTGTSFTTGIKGNALQGAINGYVTFNVTQQIKSAESFTISYWVNTAENTTGIMAPICFVNDSTFWGNFDMFFDGQTDNSAVFKMHLFGSSGAAEAWLTGWSLTNPWNAWMHLALTYDLPSTTFTFYINGIAQGNSMHANFGIPDFTKSSKLIFNTVQFQTVPSSTSASDAQPWASYLTGALDQVRMYSTALSGDDIKALYQLENLGR